MPNKIDPFAHAKKVIAFYLKSFSQERMAVLRSNDIEPLHRMRVASRRLRAAMNVFQDFLPFAERDAWEKKIAEVGELLGRARELDVQIRFLKNSGRNAAGLIKHLRKKRKRAQKKITDTLQGFQTDEELAGLVTWLRQPRAKKYESLNKAFHGHRQKAILDRVDKLLARSACATKTRRANELHRLRIAAKKLRYTLELLRPWYGKKIDPFIRASRNIQDVLGDLHELDVLSVVLRDFSKVSALAKKCSRLRQDVYARFVQMWKHFEEKKRWEMLRRMAQE